MVGLTSLGPYEVRPTILTWGGPCSLGTMMLRKWLIFDQFGPPWPESRLLRAKTGDSGLENKHIPKQTYSQTGQIWAVLGSSKLRNRTVSWFFFGGLTSYGPKEVRPTITNRPIAGLGWRVHHVPPPPCGQDMGSCRGRTDDLTLMSLIHLSV